jgi:hypothetical protein
MVGDSSNRDSQRESMQNAEGSGEGTASPAPSAAPAKVLEPMVSYVDRAVLSSKAPAVAGQREGQRLHRPRSRFWWSR